MQSLSIDIETYSSVDLRKCGVYKYAAAPDFQILMLAWSIDNGPVYIQDCTKAKLPHTLIELIQDPDVVKTAFNAAFEITCLSAHLGYQLDASQWDCTMVRAGRAGYPMSLATASAAMGLPQQKSSAGMQLIRYFSIPCKPTLTNGGRLRNLPEHAPQKWAEFMDYCRQDVVVEKAIRDRLINLPITETEKKLWALDQKINSYGIELDMQFVNNALRIHDEYVDHLKLKAYSITGLNNPNSVTQLSEWLRENGEEVDTLRKADVTELLKKVADGDVKTMLKIRQEMGKTSVKKYKAMQEAVGADSRVRGTLQFYGANRTGRWAGRLLQLQNVPQNHILDLDLARNVVREGDGELLQMLYGNVPDTLSQLIRTAIVPAAGKKFMVVDFSSIELIVAAWLAGEQWVIDEFKTTRKIYEKTAARMFNIPIEQVTKTSHWRQKGKIASLACQYSGSVGALITMGALAMGLTEEELPSIVEKWRIANPAIKTFWYKLQDAALEAIRYPGSTVKVRDGVLFKKMGGDLYMKLPSGRLLAYVQAKEGVNRFGGAGITFMGMDQVTKKWAPVETYSGKLFENLCQAVARDCLVEAMLRLDEAGYKIVLHVHDEVVIECDMDADLKEVSKLMTDAYSWSGDLPLAAEGFECQYYQK